MPPRQGLAKVPKAPPPPTPCRCGLSAGSGLDSPWFPSGEGSSHCFQPLRFGDWFRVPRTGVNNGVAESPGKEQGLSRVPAGVSLLTWPWASPLASLGLSFSICEMEVIRPTFESEERD